MPLQLGLCQTWSETLKTGFLASWLLCFTVDAIHIYYIGNPLGSYSVDRGISLHFHNIIQFYYLFYIFNILNKSENDTLFYSYTSVYPNFILLQNILSHIQISFFGYSLHFDLFLWKQYKLSYMQFKKLGVRKMAEAIQ